MKMKTSFVLAVVIVVLCVGQSFGTLQKISKPGVTAITGESWFSVAGTGNSSGWLTLEIGFDNEYQFDVFFESSSDGTARFYSLQDVVEQINAVSLNLAVDGTGTPMAYTAAYIIDSIVTAGEYSLMLSSRGDSMSPMQILSTSSTDAALSGNFGDLGTDLTGDNMYFFAAIPEPATLALIGLGGLFLRRRRNYQL